MITWLALIFIFFSILIEESLLDKEKLLDELNDESHRVKFLEEHLAELQLLLDEKTSKLDALERDFKNQKEIIENLTIEINSRSKLTTFVFVLFFCLTFELNDSLIQIS